MHKFLVGKAERMRTLRRLKCSWEDSTKWILRCGLEKSGVGQGQVAGYCDCGNEILDAIICSAKKFISFPVPHIS